MPPLQTSLVEACAQGCMGQTGLDPDHHDCSVPTWPEGWEEGAPALGWRHESREDRMLSPGLLITRSNEKWRQTAETVRTR